MKLTRLELSGFKSFADTIELPFDDGVTAIVGPNGCGKSNISDAVRWVLGEQRVRLLRGARMDEVIFQGSIKRRPINVAEASLHLDNLDDSLPLAYNEVVVTRRLSRAGQSEYLLNGTPVRLRDLHDLLQGTGLGSDVGVVIEAQMIDRLLSDRPDERRSLFEEAAGIGLYRDRKISTERRLEKTSEDLQRLDDLISEVRTQVRSLARQRGRAERYEKFTAERFDLVMTLAQRELTEFEQDENRLRQIRDGLANRIPQTKERLAERERQRENHLQARATAEVRRAELQRRLAETRVEIERLEGDVNVAREKLGNAAVRKSRAADERQQAEGRASRADLERDAAAAERIAAEQARKSVQTELDLRVDSEGEVRGQLAEQRSLVRDTEAELQRQAELQRSMAAEKAVVEREIGDITGQLDEATGRHEEAARELERAQQQVETTRLALDQCRNDERDAASELERARHSLAAAREREAAIRVDLRAADERIAQLGARREALSELERVREGLAPAAQELLRSRDRFGEGAILGPLSDFVSAPQSEARLAERLLADWLHAVLVRDEATVSAVQDWHGEVQPGPLILLPASPGPSRSAERDLPSEITAMPPAEAWASALLEGSNSLDAEGNAVRLSNGAVYLHSGDSTGPLSRRADIDGLTRNLDTARNHLTELKHGVQRAVVEHASAESALETAATRTDQSRTALHEAQGACDEAVRHHHREERESSEAGEASARLKHRFEERSERLERLASDLSAAGEKRERLAGELERYRTALTELESAQEAARERRVHWQVEEAQVSAREEAARERETRAEHSLAEARSAMSLLEREIADIEQSTSESEEKLARWEDDLAERRVAVEEINAAALNAEEAVETADSNTRRTEDHIAEVREELNSVTEQSHTVELELTQSQGHRQALVERIEAEWHKPLSELVDSTSNVEGDTAELREEAERLARALDALGPVNPLAVLEHAEEVKRLDFLEEQRADLVEARSSLLQALHEIDETARNMFLETFGQIQENFLTVFRTLFEGGECDVRLEDGDDPLSSPIGIFAAPRGKRIQRIHLLSSGERALVALSLLFAIYLTKPAPFCLLDEVDAPLDDANVTRFVRLLDEFKADTQFIVITHNPRTMQVADAVYGVTMQEPGISTIVGVRLGREAVAS
jgi:chromosome segregation protein